MYIGKGKDRQEETSTGQVPKELLRSVQELSLRITSLENFLMDHFKVPLKDLQISFSNAHQQMIIDSFDHEKKEFEVKLDPIIMTNE